MQLILLRHGKAEDHGHPGGDGVRGLVKKGHDQAKAAAHFLKSADALPEIVLTSPVRRALETAEIFCKEAGLSRPLVQPWLACGMAAETALHKLAGFQEFGRVAIVGHEPDFSSLIAWALEATGDAVEMKKGGLACLEIHPPSRYSRLLYLVPPKFNPS